MIARLCFAMTNFHVSLKPLRSQDSNFYANVLARYQSMAANKKRQRQQSVQLSRAGAHTPSTPGSPEYA